MITFSTLLKRGLLAVACYFSCSFLIAQPITFKLTYGIAGDEEARFAHVLPDNSILLAGSTTTGNHGEMDGLLVKLDAHGAMVWSSTFGGAMADFFKFILPCSDGNFIAYGETRSFGAGGVDIFLVKFNTNGNLLWSKTYGGIKDELASGGICETSNGYLITGGTQSFGAGYYDIYVIKTDFSGNAVWTKCWGTGGGDAAGEPIPTINGDYWIPGGCFVSTNNHNGILLRITSNGILAESRQYGGSTNEGNECFAPGGAGMTASSHTWFETPEGLHQQSWMMSYNPNGSLAWCKRYPIDGNYRINAENCPDGGFVFAPNRNGTDIEVAYLVKTNSEGEVDWSYRYYFEGTGDMYHAVPCPDGGYLAVGYRNGVGKDIFVLKTTAAGLVLNCRPVSADIRSKLHTLNISAFQVSPVSAGSSAPSNTQSQALALDPLVICSSGATSVFEEENATNGLSISPNPAYGSTVNLAYALLETDHIMIELTDIQGKRWNVLSNELRQAGSHQETLELPTGLAPGLYFVSLRNSRGSSFVTLMLVGR